MHDEHAAVTALRRALALEPELMEANQMLLSVLVGQKRFADAGRVADALQQRSPLAGGGYQLEGDLRSAQGQPAAALAAYERAFALAPAGP